MSSRGEYNIFDLSSSREWGEYLQRLPGKQQDVYYTPEYYRLYQELGDGSARCFVFSKGEDYAIYPFLLNSVNALGYDLDKEYYDIQGAYGYNGVVSNNYSHIFRNKFYEALDDFYRSNNIIAEFTRFNPILKNHLFSEEKLKVVFDRKTMVLDLDRPFDEIKSHFHRQTNNQIRKALSNPDITVKTYRNNPDCIDSFIKIYHNTMDRVKSIPYLYFNKNYFENLIEKIQSAFIFVYFDETPIACCIIMFNNIYVNAHLGGSLTEFKQYSPLSILYQEMIKFGHENNCKFFHAGGGNSNKENDPLLLYKLSFSKTTSDFFVGRRILNQKIYDEVIKQWGSNYPERVEPYKNLLLKYRY
jgi:hypothetical protein